MDFQNLPASLPGKPIRKILKKVSQPTKELMSCYRCAMMEVETKFRVLNEEFSLASDRNPIETIKTRLKSMESIGEKMERLQKLPTAENIENTLNDVAGIRVICGFPSDIFIVANALLSQDDITLVEMKDYINHPKPSGYRSLHLIVEVPIFLHNRKKNMRVEVQLRTMSMDWWASLEHQIRYKKSASITPEIEQELLQCALAAAEMDEKMEAVQKKIYGDAWNLSRD